jgi:hypothetical protein
MSLAGEPSLKNCDLAVLLSHVCHTWRQIIVQAPLLWKFVTMHSSGSPRYHSATVDSFLRRSQGQSFTFALYLHKAPTWSHPSTTAAISQHAHRVRGLCVTASDFTGLSPHLVAISSLPLTSLEYHEVVVRPSRASGSFTAISRRCSVPKHEKAIPRYPTFIQALPALPTWPSYLDITTLSFMYSSLKLLDIFLIVRMAQATLQHLKIYFQCRPGILTPTHSDLIEWQRLDLPELRSIVLRVPRPTFAGPLPGLCSPFTA